MLYFFQHPSLPCLKDALHLWVTPTYVARIRYADDADNPPLLPLTELTCMQKIIGCLLYSSCTVEPFMRIDIDPIASDQLNAIRVTHNFFSHLLDYAASNQ